MLEINYFNKKDKCNQRWTEINLMELRNIRNKEF